MLGMQDIFGHSGLRTARGGMSLLTQNVHVQIESLLDESTAELAKMELSPMLSTVEANFKIRKPVPLFTSLCIKCEVGCWKRAPHATLLLFRQDMQSSSVRACTPASWLEYCMHHGLYAIKALMHALRMLGSIGQTGIPV